MSQNSLYYASRDNAHHLLDETTVSVFSILCLGFGDHPDSRTRVYASCDGLLLVGDDERNKFVLNPVAKEIRGAAQLPFAVCPPSLWKF